MKQSIPQTLRRAIWIVLALSSLNASAQWISQSVPGDISFLLTVDFSSTQYGVAGGYVLGGNYAGRAVYTTNGGMTWNPAQVPDSVRALLTVQLLGDGLGYGAGAHNSSLGSQATTPTFRGFNTDHSAATARNNYFQRIGMDGRSDYRGIFLRTTDFGQSWFAVGALPESTYYLHGLSFVGPDSGFVTASVTPQVGQTRVLQTTNGGTSWITQTTSDSIVSLPSIQFHNYLQGFAVGYQRLNNIISGVVLRTTDGGAHWEQTDFPEVDNFNGVSISSATTAYASE